MNNNANSTIKQKSSLKLPKLIATTRTMPSAKEIRETIERHSSRKVRIDSSVMIAAVFVEIFSSPNGITPRDLEKNLGYNRLTLRNIINTLKKAELIKDISDATNDKADIIDANPPGRTINALAEIVIVDSADDQTGCFELKIGYDLTSGAAQSLPCAIPVYQTASITKAIENSAVGTSDTIKPENISGTKSINDRSSENNQINGTESVTEKRTEDIDLSSEASDIQNKDLPLTKRIINLLIVHPLTLDTLSVELMVPKTIVRAKLNALRWLGIVSTVSGDNKRLWQLKSKKIPANINRLVEIALLINDDIVNSKDNCGEMGNIIDQAKKKNIPKEEVLATSLLMAETGTIVTEINIVSGTEKVRKRTTTYTF